MCGCKVIGRGTQLFRVKKVKSKFDVLESLGPDYDNYLDTREVWACKSCGRLFAYVKIFRKDLEEIIIAKGGSDASDWDWHAISETATKVRWRGPGKDQKIIWS